MRVTGRVQRPVLIDQCTIKDSRCAVLVRSSLGTCRARRNQECKRKKERETPNEDQEMSGRGSEAGGEEGPKPGVGKKERKTRPERVRERER